jgi:hypothetical protein
MLILKIAHTGSDEDSYSWLGGVVTVHLIQKATKNQEPRPWPGYELQDNYVDHTQFLDNGRDISLLSVVFATGHDLYVACGRAWLLGPDGGTIERIAP